jgi:uncharacterized phage-associated protein
MLSVRDVAKYIIAFSHEHGDPVTNLKLQKLLYYAQAWHLALYDKPLFRERIEAWVHGPAVPPVYGEYKHFRWVPIDDDDPPELPESAREHLDEVLDVYGGLTAYYLEKMTHDEAPWRDARGDIPDDEPSNSLIEHEAMRDFYRARLDAA